MKYGEIYRDKRDGETVMIVAWAPASRQWKVVHLGFNSEWSAGIELGLLLTQRMMEPAMVGDRWERVDVS